MKNIVITDKDCNQRVDKFLKKYLKEAPLSFIYKMFRKKDVKINKHWVKENYILNSGDELTIYISDAQIEEFKNKDLFTKKDLKHKIVYEDENIIIVNKPRGLLSHGDEFEKKNTLTNDVLNYLYFKGEYNPSINNGFVPGPAHRLDRNTSGLVIFGKNLESLQILENLFKDKTEVSKNYLALLYGELKEEKHVSAPLIKDSVTGMVKVTSLANGGKTAESIFTPIKCRNGYTLCNVQILTGRTHQIRVHSSYINYPVIGDAKYGNFDANKKFSNRFNYEHQFLHAYSLEFKNLPAKLAYLSNKKFSVELSDKEKSILKELELI